MNFRYLLKQKSGTFASVFEQDREKPCSLPPVSTGGLLAAPGVCDTYSIKFTWSPYFIIIILKTKQAIFVVTKTKLAQTVNPGESHFLFSFSHLKKKVTGTWEPTGSRDCERSGGGDKAGCALFSGVQPPWRSQHQSAQPERVEEPPEVGHSECSFYTESPVAIPSASRASANLGFRTVLSGVLDWESIDPLDSSPDFLGLSFPLGSTTGVDNLTPRPLPAPRRRGQTFLSGAAGPALWKGPTRRQLGQHQGQGPRVRLADARSLPGEPGC